MKFTQILYKQHIGRMIKRAWYAKRQRKVSDSRTESYLSTLGIHVIDPSEVLQPKKEFSRYFLPNYAENC